LITKIIEDRGDECCAVISLEFRRELAVRGVAVQNEGLVFHGLQRALLGPATRSMAIDGVSL
jgi:hypothetical protein